MTTDDRARFGLLVRARREELGLAQSALRGHGGPSGVTVRQIEAGIGDRPSGLTLGKLERALGWATGSAREALAGGQPRRADDAPDSSAKRPVGLGLDDAAEGVAPEMVERIRALILEIKGGGA